MIHLKENLYLPFAVMLFNNSAKPTTISLTARPAIRPHRCYQQLKRNNAKTNHESSTTKQLKFKKFLICSSSRPSIILENGIMDERFNHAEDEQCTEENDSSQSSEVGANIQDLFDNFARFLYQDETSPVPTDDDFTASSPEYLDLQVQQSQQQSEQQAQSEQTVRYSSEDYHSVASVSTTVSDFSDVEKCSSKTETSSKYYEQFGPSTSSFGDNSVVGKNDSEKVVPDKVIESVDENLEEDENPMVLVPTGKLLFPYYLNLCN